MKNYVRYRNLEAGKLFMIHSLKRLDLLHEKSVDIHFLPFSYGRSITSSHLIFFFFFFSD